MATVFYDHMIDWQKLIDELDRLEIGGEERQEILEHSEHVIHTEVLLVFAAHLPNDHHHEFLERFAAAPHDMSHLEFLAAHGSGDVSQKVKKRTEEVIAEIIADLREE